MKKIVSLFLVFVLVFAVATTVYAASKPRITKQPETATVKAGGKVSFSIKTSGTVDAIIWNFVDPESGNTYTGQKLQGAVSGVKIDGATNGKKITLKRVPESMHGWTVYAHVNGNGYKIDSDKVMILISGMEPPVTPEPDDNQSSPADKTDDSADAGISDDGDNDGDDEEDSDTPQTFTVTANAKVLYSEDDPDTAHSRLEFTGSGSFIVSSEDPIISWAVNGVRFEPAEPLNKFKVSNVTSAVSLDVRVRRASEPVLNEDHLCRISCTGCTFSYIQGGLMSVTEGEVPEGARISVIANSSDLAAGGYVINGDEAQGTGKSSIQLTVTDDTEIVCSGK